MDLSSEGRKGGFVFYWIEMSLLKAHLLLQQPTSDYGSLDGRVVKTMGGLLDQPHRPHGE